MKIMRIVPKVGDFEYKNGKYILTYIKYARSDYCDCIDIREEGKITRSLAPYNLRSANEWLKEEGYPFHIDLTEEIHKDIRIKRKQMEEIFNELEELKRELRDYNANKEE